jgi:hypothetical protein
MASVERTPDSVRVYAFMTLQSQHCSKALD